MMILTSHGAVVDLRNEEETPGGKFRFKLFYAVAYAVAMFANSVL